MRINSVVHTGPNIQLGGLNEGFCIPAYHVGILGVVNNEPTKPAQSGTTIEIINFTILFICFISNVQQIVLPLRYFQQKRNETSIFYVLSQCLIRFHYIYFLKLLHFLFLILE